MVCKTNPSPDSHNSTPSHQLRIPFTGLTLFRLSRNPNMPTCQHRQLKSLILSIIAWATSIALVSRLADPGSEERRSPKKTTWTSIRQFSWTPMARACGVGRSGGILGSTAVAVFVAATTVLVTRMSLMEFVVLIGPFCSVVVVALHCCHCCENFANSASARAAVGKVTTPSITLITWAGSPLFHHDSDATSWTSEDS